MAALVFIEFDAGGHPGRRPVLAAGVIAQIEIASTHIERGVVVAIACQAAQAGIFVKGVAAGRVRDQTEIVFTAQVVDPGQGSVWAGDYIFTLCVVEISEFHNDSIPVGRAAPPLHLD